MTDLHEPNAKVETFLPAEGDEALELLAQTVEAEVHAGGWDQMPIVGTLWQLDDGHLGWCTQYVPEELLGDPGQLLFRMAQELEQPYGRAGATMLMPPAFLGFGLIAEGWGVRLPHAPTKEDLEAWRNSEDSLESHPDRTEERLFLAATINGKFIALSRQRDRVPECHVLDIEAAQPKGGPADSLRRMVNVARDVRRAQMQ